MPPDLEVDEEAMADLIERHWDLNRVAVSEDTDRLVRYLSKTMDADVLEAGSGEECLTWRIPKRWEVEKAEIRTKDGEVVASFEDNPLHLWTHSVPVDREISREELVENHVETDPHRPQEIPYHYANGYRFDAEEWGFSLPYETVEALDDSVYEVEIDARLDTDGTLKVVDAKLPGRRGETILVAAHTCHPAIVSDGLANIAVARELYRWLARQDERRYSYRFVFGPEYFGAAAFLDKIPDREVEDLWSGIYLDTLGNHEPLGFQHSFQGDAYIDRIVENVVSTHTRNPVERGYRELIGNDEVFYNGPGFEIPTVGLARTVGSEYHYDSDNLENLNSHHLKEGYWVLRRIVEVIETDPVPVRNYDGPLYQSRFDISTDVTTDPDWARTVERMQILMDGDRSLLDIAHEFDADYFNLLRFVSELEEEGLIDLQERNPRTGDSGTLRPTESRNPIGKTIDRSELN